jgi:hypothetical protein
MIERSSRSRRRFVALLAVVAMLALWHPARAHVRAAGLLVRFTDPEAKGFLADTGRHPVDVRDEIIAGTRARVYSPGDVEDPPGLVVVHEDLRRSRAAARGRQRSVAGRRDRRVPRLLDAPHASDVREE